MKHKSSAAYLLGKYNNTNYYSKEEQLKLIAKAQKGCIKSRNALIGSVIRYIIMHAGKYARKSGLDLDELISEGIVGAIDAIRCFDLNVNNNFLTYAAYWIIRGFREHKYSSKALRTPKNVSIEIERFSRDLLLGNDITKYPDLIRKAYHQSSVLFLDAPAKNSKGRCKENFALKETLIHPESVEYIEKIIDDHDSKTLIKKLIVGFKKRNQTILAMRFGLSPFKRPHTLEEIGKTYGLTREAIRLQINRCLDKLKRKFEERGICKK